MKKEFYDTIISIAKVKKQFEKELASRLCLVKVDSPLFVKPESGLQDDLSGKEKAVEFYAYEERFQVAHSLAKWKRYVLGKYDFKMYTGLYTEMKAIRKEENVDDIHSLYVEQWDWEKIISKEDRTIEYLKDTVCFIYKAIRQTVIYYKKIEPKSKVTLPKTISFITSQELEDLYPDKMPKEREYLIAKEKIAVFIIGIGDQLKSGQVHDLRSPDYDDWGLDGDLIIYDKLFDRAIEISSMGIRVDEKSLVEQLKKSGCDDRIRCDYHQKIIKKELPYTIGGGIGTSRLLMFVLGKEHVAEVHASSWPTEIEKQFKFRKINFL